MEMDKKHNQLAIENLSGERGDYLLFENIGLELQSGQLLFLKGKNGSGKTTLLKMIAGLISIERGDIVWNGRSIKKNQSRFFSESLYIGHLNGLKDDLSAIENLTISSNISGHKLNNKEACKALNFFGLEGKLNTPVKYLSQGQKRRVSLSKLFNSKESLWILDEPFSSLDFSAVEKLKELFLSHLKSSGILILSSHQEINLTKNFNGQFIIDLSGEKFDA